jgi:sarcosine oxidase subunit gamma
LAHDAAMREASWADCRLDPSPELAQIVLRLAPEGRGPVEAALGGPLPAPNRVARSPVGDVLWLGPDEWLVVAELAQEAAVRSVLGAAVGADRGAITVTSAARTPFVLAGAAARDVLATCCALDLDPRVFPPGHCAQTLLAKAPALLQTIDPSPAVRLFVRPSFVSYVVLWLVDGMAGIRAITASTA